MKTLLYILALSSVLFATHSDTASCKKCHPTIAKEFQSSMHKKSSVYEDKVHAAVWDKHPAKAKGNYNCAECHTPNTTSEEVAHEGITCISCHTIKSVEQHASKNKTIYAKDKHTLFSAEEGRESEVVKYKTTTTWWGNKTTIGSAYHDLDYTNKDYYNGNMCMGCHSHKQNSHQFDVCRTDNAGAKNTKENCITCHMPKIPGTATTVRLSQTHAYHGFAGARVEPRMLAKYVGLSLSKKADSFDVTVDNQAPHDLMTHPLRVVQLKATLVRDDKYRALETHSFVKIIGHEGKPSMPWLATEVVKDNMIKADEKRTVSYKEKLQTGDRVEVIIGYYVVNPKVLKKLNLDGEKELKKFTVLKSQNFTIE